MTPPPRRRMRAPVRSSRPRLASLFFCIGCLVVLAVTFALGVAAGRRWPTGLPLPGLGGAPAATAAAREIARRSEARGLDKDKVKTRTEPPPVLTFYQDLTAPLTSPPPRGTARPARVDAKTTDAVKPTPKPGDPTKPGAPDAAPFDDAAPHEVAEAPSSSATVPGPSVARESRFTVQVGSFKDRAQAEALRARLAEGTVEAYVSEVDVGGVPQYRVRVGAFATREGAREAAARLAQERQLATYVTTR